MFFVLIHLNIMVILNQKHVLHLVKYLLIVVRISKLTRPVQNRENNKSKLTRPVQNQENNKSKLTRPVQNRENNKSKLTRPVQNRENDKCPN
ncbi:hypothetical protein DERF_001793 [Dermatophagoides farinae]|uniref:Uncharacterized protein n=1 Tax=Dermatophagoides farinae TaxID=6954 RepID=A0A922I9B4_DERFA|nr:hypothetical protein DERF_001793 [Dermatophagoides farinae]